MEILKKLGIQEGLLAKKIAIVTGAARGIGKAVAETLAFAGASVVIADISEAGRQVAQNLMQSGKEAHFIKTDVKNEEEIHTLIKQTQNKFGQVDILVNNAVMMEVVPIIESPIKVWDQEYQSNLRASVIAAKAVLPGMIARQTGTIVNMVSPEGMPLVASYSATKAGIKSFTMSLSKELSPQMGVSMIAFFPGSVNTPLTKESLPKIAHYTGLTAEQVIKQLSNNPGYDDFLPVEHCAASLVKIILNAKEYYGQVVDAFYPLVNAGIIRVEEDNADAGNLQVPNPKVQMAELIRQNQNLEIRINERTKELEEALDHLKKAQDRLIQSEKMAALGQLIAGIAHEINTPLGAIRAANSNIENNLNQYLTSFPELFATLSQEQPKPFFLLIQRSLSKNLSITTKEERRFRRAISSQLEESEVANPDSTADTLVDMGIYDHIEELIPLLKSPKKTFLLQAAFDLSGLLRNSKNISLAVERTSKMVFALKSYSHFDQSGDMIKADVISSIETVLTIYQNLFNQNMQVIKNYETVPEIRCYPDELSQVWTNIIHNALQAMDYKGKLIIDVFTEGENVVVKVTDSGIGIPEEVKTKIFEPFYTTKPQGEGTGLGLSIVKQIIDKHKGIISVDSIPGKTTFSVRLPVS